MIIIKVIINFNNANFNNKWAIIDNEILCVININRDEIVICYFSKFTRIAKILFYKVTNLFESQF